MEWLLATRVVGWKPRGKAPNSRSAMRIDWSSTGCRVGVRCGCVLGELGNLLCHLPLFTPLTPCARAHDATGRERRVLELFVDCLGWQFYERKRSVFLMAIQLLDFVFVWLSCAGCACCVLWCAVSRVVFSAGFALVLHWLRGVATSGSSSGCTGIVTW